MSGVKDRIKMFESFSPDSTSSPSSTADKPRPSSASSAKKRKPFGKSIGDAWTGAAKTNSANSFIDSPSASAGARNPEFGYKVSYPHKRPTSADRSKYEGKISPKFKTETTQGFVKRKQAFAEASEAGRTDEHDGEKENVVSSTATNDSPMNTGRSVRSTGSNKKAYKSVMLPKHLQKIRDRSSKPAESSPAATGGRKEEQGSTFKTTRSDKMKALQSKLGNQLTFLGGGGGGGSRAGGKEKEQSNEELEKSRGAKKSDKMKALQSKLGNQLTFLGGSGGGGAGGKESTASPKNRAPKSSKRRGRKKSSKLKALQGQLGKQLKFPGSDLYSSKIQDKEDLEIISSFASPTKTGTSFSKKNNMTPGMEAFMGNVKRREPPRNENTAPLKDSEKVVLPSFPPPHLEDPPETIPQTPENLVAKDVPEGQHHGKHLLNYTDEAADSISYEEKTSNDKFIEEPSTVETFSKEEEEEPAPVLPARNFEEKESSGSDSSSEEDGDSSENSSSEEEEVAPSKPPRVPGRRKMQGSYAAAASAAPSPTAHLKEEIERLRTELETARGDRPKPFGPGSDGSIPKSSRLSARLQKMDEHTKRGKELVNIYAEKSRPYIKKGLRRARFCLPSCGKLFYADERSEIFSRVVALLWLHIAGSFLLLFCAICAISEYSWTPQFSRNMHGMSLMVLLFVKAITSTLVVGSIYKNMDTAACMFPFYRCWKSEFEPMIIYEKAWLKGMTYGKLVDFAFGIWTWVAYSSANRIVGRPYSESLSALMFFVFVGLFLVDVWAPLLLCDMGLLIRRWLDSVPEHYVRDGYTLHGVFQTGSDEEEEVDLSDDEEMGTKGAVVRDSYFSPSGNAKSNGGARPPSETPRTPLSKLDSARAWGAVTERDHNRPAFVPKLSLASKGSTKQKKSHLSGMPKFGKGASSTQQSAPAESTFTSVQHHSGGYDSVNQHDQYGYQDNAQGNDNLASIHEEYEDHTVDDPWDRHVDEHGNQYFIHRVTFESVWEKPVGQEATTADDQGNGWAESTEANHSADLTGAAPDVEYRVLSNSSHIEAQDFEFSWAQMNVYSTVMLELNTVPSPEMVTENIASKGFHVVAQGVKGCKFTVYFFAKNYYEDAHFYGEIRFDSKTRHLTAVFKCNQKASVDIFLSALRLQDFTF